MARCYILLWFDTGTANSKFSMVLIYFPISNSHAVLSVPDKTVDSGRVPPENVFFRPLPRIISLTTRCVLAAQAGASD